MAVELISSNFDLDIENRFNDLWGDIQGKFNQDTKNPNIRGKSNCELIENGSKDLNRSIIFSYYIDTTLLCYAVYCLDEYGLFNRADCKKCWNDNERKVSMIYGDENICTISGMGLNLEFPGHISFDGIKNEIFNTQVTFEREQIN